MQTSTRIFALALTTAALATVSATAHAQVPDYVRVRGITANGTGCPAGSTAINVSPDWQALTLYTDQFVAEIGPGVSIADGRKFCQVNLDLDFPAGWQYTIDSVDVRGYASLEPGVTGRIATTYYFQGQARQASLVTTLNGPYDGDYLVRDTLGLSSVVWSPCGAQRSLNFKLSLSLSSRSRSARGILTSDDGNTFRPRLRWQRCR